MGWVPFSVFLLFPRREVSIASGFKAISRFHVGDYIHINVEGIWFLSIGMDMILRPEGVVIHQTCNRWIIRSCYFNLQTFCSEIKHPGTKYKPLEKKLTTRVFGIWSILKLFKQIEMHNSTIFVGRDDNYAHCQPNPMTSFAYLRDEQVPSDKERSIRVQPSCTLPWFTLFLSWFSAVQFWPGTTGLNLNFNLDDHPSSGLN